MIQIGDALNGISLWWILPIMIIFFYITLRLRVLTAMVSIPLFSYIYFIEHPKELYFSMFLGLMFGLFTNALIELLENLIKYIQLEYFNKKKAN